jgi:hypothetical protein
LILLIELLLMLQVMGEDPATNSLFHILTIPLLYPEDEQALTDQMCLLIGE